MRVVSVIASISSRVGGPSTQLVTSVPHLRGLGVDVVVHATDMRKPASSRPFERLRPEDLPAGAEECEIHVHRVGHPRRLCYSRALARALDTAVQQADLVRVHSLYLHPNHAAAAAALRHSRPYVVTPHGALDPWLRDRGRLRKAAASALFQRRLLERAAAIHFTTEEEHELARPAIPAATPTYVVPNGVDVDRFAALPDRDLARQALGLPADARVVLFLGRLTAKKGLDRLLEAVARTAVNYHLLVVGPDDEDLTEGLRVQALALGVADRLHLAGPRYGDERLQALAAADAWALLSHTENFSNAAVEAMAAGLPVLLSPAVNIAPDAERAGAALVAADPVAATEALDRLAVDSALADELGRAAVAFAGRFSWTSTSARLAEMLTACAGTSRPRTR